MQCNICQRPWSTRLPFSCACCARETLYQTRLNLAHTLLEHEAARSQIEQDLKECCLSVPKESVSTPSTRYNHHVSLLLDNVNAQRCASQERTQLVLDHARNLGIEAGNIRDEVASRRASTTERRKQLAAATERLARQEALNITPVLKSIGRTRDLWKALRTKTAESRLLLCREAASLYDLKKQAKAHARSKSNGYVIGGLPIYHLRELNGAHPGSVSTVNAILAHFVHLLSHYLSLRLPAEITLPHREYPFPTVLPPASSYTGLGVPFSNVALSNSASNSPSASRTLTSQTPRPRPLYVKKQLSSLAKDDRQTYAAFVEGMTLLAWDIAWLCKTQGMEVGDRAWEDVCNMGKNLWKLTAAEQGNSKTMIRSQDRRTKQGVNAHPQHPARTVPQGNQQSDASIMPTSFGQWSHDNVFSNLLNAAGSEHMRTWRLQDPARVDDRVKHMLLSDRTGAGWEILEGKDLETESIRAESMVTAAAVGEASTVAVGSGGGFGRTIRDPTSSLDDPPPDVSQEKTKGTSGWTKLKSR